MALTVEDGTGVAGADTFATVAQCEAWSMAFWNTAFTGDTAAKEAALRRAFAFMRSLPWASDYPFPTMGGEVPVLVRDAQCAFAKVEIDAPGFLSPVVNIGDRKVLVEVKGIRWEPRSAPNTIEAARPVVTVAMDMLAGFLTVGQTMFLERA